MKTFAALFLTVLLFGCAHQNWICEGGQDSYLTGDAEEFRVNFRDDHILKSDVILIGSMQLGRRAVLHRVKLVSDEKPVQSSTPGDDRSMVIVSARLDSNEVFEEIEIAIEHGVSGSKDYSRDLLFRASGFRGIASIEPTECDGAIEGARLVLNFKRDREWFRLESQVTRIPEKRPNQK